MQSFWEFLLSQQDKLIRQTISHISLTIISVLAAIAVGVPLGILVTRRKRLSGAVLGVAGVLQTIPSIALLGFMIPLLGIGAAPAITALFLYALLPIIRNTFTGINGVDATVKEAARGMGMSGRQILFKVELPLAMPVMIAGIRTATVINVGVATLAAYIAAGGLGEFIFGGIALNNTNMILAGAIPAALLALCFDFILSRVQKANWRKYKLKLGLGILIVCIAAGFAMLPSGSKKLQAGFTPEFMGRMDGDLGLKKYYGLQIPTVVISDAVMYQAMYEGKLDVVSGYSTDGRIRAFDLTILEDDKHIFPPYYCAPLVRRETLQQYPELAPALQLLNGRINDSVMTYLNYKADYLHQAPEKVAEDFLQEQGLLKPSRFGKKGVIRIGSKIFTEQYILCEMYRLLIEGNTDLAVSSKTGLGGTKICFDALRNDQIDFYPEYTGTGLLVILQPAEEASARVMRDKDSTYAFVKQQFEAEYQLEWLPPIGFNNAYALMMRKNMAAQLQLNSISDLTHYLTKKRTP